MRREKSSKENSILFLNKRSNSKESGKTQKMLLSNTLKSMIIKRKNLLTFRHSDAAADSLIVDYPGYHYYITNASYYQDLQSGSTSALYRSFSRPSSRKSVPAGPDPSGPTWGGWAEPGWPRSSTSSKVGGGGLPLWPPSRLGWLENLLHYSIFPILVKNSL